MADRPGQSGPTRAFRASLKSPVLTPFRYSQGINSSMLLVFRRYGGRIFEVKGSAWSAGRRSRTLGCCTSTGPTPVVIFRLGRNPLRTTWRRPCSSCRCARSASQSSTSCWIIWVSIFWAPARRISVITSRLWGTGTTNRSMVLSRMVAYSLGLVFVTNHFVPKYAAFFNLPRTQHLVISPLGRNTTTVAYRVYGSGADVCKTNSTIQDFVLHFGRLHRLSS